MARTTAFCLEVFMLLNNAVSKWKSAVFCHEETVLPYNSHEHYSILYSSSDNYRRRSISAKAAELLIQ
mgnify:FL=1